MSPVKRATKTAIALVATALFPLIAVAPASATTSFDTFTIDCATDLDPTTPIQFPLFGYPLNVTLVNCETDNIWDEAESGNATIDGDAAAWVDPLDVGVNPATMSIAGPVTVEFRDADDYLLGVAQFDNPIDIPDPDGVLLASDDHEIPLIAPEFTLGTEQEINDGVDIEMGYRCSLVAGPHVYNTAPLTVSKSDEYTIRVTGQSPTGDGFHPNDGVNFWDDSVIVVYSEFDPAHPEDNIVGCGDELEGDAFSPVLDTYWWYRTADMDPVSKSWPNVRLSLEAGHYTLVYATYEYLSSADWESGVDGWWEPAPQIITTELWGPTDGATLSDAELASTGVDPSFGLWTGLALAGTGVAITVARRRAQRA